MAYQFPPDVQQLIHEAVTRGNYSTEDDVLREALHALIERDEDLAAIQAGIDDNRTASSRPLGS